MVRPHWQSLIEKALRKRSVVWLSGVRRVGKTSLCQSLNPSEYLDCELLRVRELLRDPEFFFQNRKPGLLILDEIHKMDHPAEILKVAADHFPHVKVVATGSSTLSAHRKFSDALTDRKTDVWLTPVLQSELKDFGSKLDDRMLYGGLPRFLLEKNDDEKERIDWLDQFWAKDIAELFRIERRHSFMTFCQLLLAQSGGAFEASQFSRPCEVSRQTVTNYLSSLEMVHFAHVLRPYTKNKSQEILSQPKVYGFDTGFVCALRGITALREDDRGMLLEHLVLNEIHGYLGRKDIVHYWRTKQGLEIDFILTPKKSAKPIAIECKTNHRKFDPAAMVAFRKLYPQGENWLVTLTQKEPSLLRVPVLRGEDLVVQIVPLDHLASRLQSSPQPSLL